MEFLLLERDEVLLVGNSIFDTSSVIISLEFVLLNQRLTVSEDLLPLSVR